MQLKGANILLDNVLPSDLPEITEWYQDPDFIQLYEGPGTSTRDATQMQLWLTARRKKKGAQLFALRLIANQRLLGILDITPLSDERDGIWMGIAIGSPSNRGKGYGREAMTLVLDYALLDQRLDCTQLLVYNYNKSAIKLYNKLGFQYQGVYRSYLHSKGWRYDLLLYTMSREDWIENRQYTDM